MIPISKVFDFFNLNDDPRLPLTLLYGREAFVGLDHKVDWGEFACCAFYRKLLGFNWPMERMVGICSITFPAIKKNVADLGKGDTWPMIVLLIDNEFMLLGENHLFDMKTWEELDKAAFEVGHGLFQMSVCFMVSSIAVIEAGRFLKKEQKYARACPFVSPTHASKSVG